MPEATINTQILGELRTQSKSLETIGRTQIATSESLGELTRSMTLVLERQKTGVGNSGTVGSEVTRSVTWGNLLTLLGALFAIFALVVTQQADRLDAFSTGASTFAESQRAEWRNHDARVVSINTEQSMAVRHNCDMIRALWSKAIPDVALPDCSTPARPGEDFH